MEGMTEHFPALVPEDLQSTERQCVLHTASFLTNSRISNMSIKHFFSEIQNIWDSNKNEARINLVVCESLYSMMTYIFDDKKEPLYGRATSRIRLREFPLATLREIMRDNNPDYTPDDLLAMYMITGGVAKYVEQLHKQKAFTKDRIIEAVLSFGFYFIDEGKELLSDEFGKDYGNYFSILSAIAGGYYERGEIKSYTGVEAGGYLDKLENTYDLVYRYRPYLASENICNVRYGIKDNFLNFWFRFIYIIDYVEKEIIPRYAAFDKAHQEGHVRMVIEQSLKLAEHTPSMNSDIVYIIAAFHDLGLVNGRENHHKDSRTILESDDFVKSHFTRKQIVTMGRAVEDYRASIQDKIISNFHHKQPLIKDEYDI